MTNFYEGDFEIQFFKWLKSLKKITEFKIKMIMIRKKIIEEIILFHNDPK